MGLSTSSHNNSTMRISYEQELPLIKRLYLRFLTIAGYLVPLVQSIPAWTGLMTLPFASYLILLFANLPVNLPRALIDFFAPFHILEKACVVIGFIMLVSATSYLVVQRARGLIVSGPYGWVRHPQYLGMILLTLGFTSWSVWILNNTFGIGFLNVSQTIGVWFIELLAYILLANIEEQHLSRTYLEAFERYRERVPFFIPFMKTGRSMLDVILSILLPSLLLFGLVFFGQISPI